MVTLESAKLFRFLKPEELKVLRTIAQEKRFPAGKEVFREGDPGDGVFVVKDGLVEICGGLTPETRRVFSQIHPGDVFGEMAVIEHRPRSATAIAIRDTTVYYIPRGEMLTFIERSPGLALSLLQDMSHRLREFNQQHLREMLQSEQLAVVGRFAHSIVHDLKNPLTVISLTAEMVCAPNAKPELRAQSHERIRKQIERISDLVGEILQFTQGGQVNVALAPMDYAAYIRQILDDLRHETEFKSVKVELANPPPAVTLQINPKRLRRVFLNLTHNATDVMPDGGKIILRFSQNAKEVVTEVEDTGPGIPQEIADKLFEVFTTHGKAHGTGLGLSICKKIVEDHGGRIWAKNEKGRGAVFAFALPLPK